MDQHRAREDELLDLERLQPVDQSAGALHGDLLIERIRIARDVVISGKVDHRGDAIAKPRAHLVERGADRFVRSEVYVDRRRGRRRVRRTGAIEADNRVAFAKPSDQRGGYKTARTGDEDQFARVLVAHGPAAFDVGHDAATLIHLCCGTWTGPLHL